MLHLLFESMIDTMGMPVSVPVSGNSIAVATNPHVNP